MLLIPLFLLFHSLRSQVQYGSTANPFPIIIELDNPVAVSSSFLDVNLAVDTAWMVDVSPLTTASCETQIYFTQGSTPLQFWIETSPCVSQSTSIWVRVPSVVQGQLIRFNFSVHEAGYTGPTSNTLSTCTFVGLTKETSCPDQWTEATDFSGRALRGVAVGQTTAPGGAPHSHPTSLYDFFDNYVGTIGEWSPGGSGLITHSKTHGHRLELNATESNNEWLPHVKLNICEHPTGTLSSSSSFLFVARNLTYDSNWVPYVDVQSRFPLGADDPSAGPLVGGSLEGHAHSTVHAKLTCESCSVNIGSGGIATAMPIPPYHGLSVVIGAQVGDAENTYPQHFTGLFLEYDGSGTVSRPPAKVVTIATGCDSAPFGYVGESVFTGRIMRGSAVSGLGFGGVSTHQHTLKILSFEAAENEMAGVTASGGGSLNLLVAGHTHTLTSGDTGTTSVSLPSVLYHDVHFLTREEEVEYTWTTPQGLTGSGSAGIGTNRFEPEAIDWILPVAISAGVVGGLILFLLLFIIFIICIKCLKNRKKKGSSTSSSSLPDAPALPARPTAYLTEDGDVALRKTVPGQNLGMDVLDQVVAAGQTERLLELSIDESLFEIDYDDLKVDRSIGSGGSSATVFHAMWRSHEVAFKAFRLHDFMDQDRFSEFEREVRIHASCSHPCLLRFMGATLKPPRVGIIMEYCSNGDLRQFIAKNPELEFPRRLDILTQVASGMEFLHGRNVVHRDLKSDNILLDNRLRAKIMDFGLSRVIHEGTQHTTRIGTSQYMAPEITLGSRGHYTGKIDVFSFGIIIFEVISGNFKPYGPGASGIELRVANNPDFRPQLENERQYPRHLVILMKKCWDHDPDVRPSFAECRQVMGQKS